MTKTSTEILTIIKEVEEKFPVDKWKFKNFDLWPLLRISFLKANTPKEYVFSKSNKTSFSVLIKKIYLLLINYINLFCIKYIKPNYFFINYDAYIHFSNNRFFNKYFEKIIIDFNLKKYSFDFCFPGNNEQYFYRCIKFCNSIVVPVIIKLVPHQKINFEKEFELQEFERVINYLVINYPDLNFYSFSKQAILNSFNIIESNYRFWYKIFKNFQPKVIFTVCYYTPQNFGMIFAANQFNIPVAELQHGNQMNYVPYKFYKVPKRGYNNLPTHFLTWDEVSKNQINSWVKDIPERKAINVGNTWLNLWSDQTWINSNFELSVKQTELLSTEKQIILFTLSPGAEILPKFLKKIMLQTQTKYKWCLRLHPRQLNEINKIKDLYMENGLFQIEVDDATSLPLPIILNKCALHITSWSSVVLEAQKYGKTSLVFSEEGKMRFKDIPDVILIDNKQDIEEEFLDFQILKNNSNVNENINFDLQSIKELVELIKP